MALHKNEIQAETPTSQTGDAKNSVAMIPAMSSTVGFFLPFPLLHDLLGCQFAVLVYERGPKLPMALDQIIIGSLGHYRFLVFSGSASSGIPDANTRSRFYRLRNPAGRHGKPDISRASTADISFRLRS